MSKIRILPEQLANQIAAGEVVERPASVVKELLENCLDAGANRIEVEIEGGGTRLIRVIDNGCGMDEDDLLLCLERHGTSKLATEEDLGAIATLGFRGEAIPSIGSVSQLTITSRPTDVALGTRVVLQYGKLVQAHEIGSSYGTTCEIRNLFGNTPARRKFLRTVRTELGHIEEVVKNYGLCSPATTFILRIDGRDTLSLDRSQSIAERLGMVMHYDGHFIEIGNEAREADGRKISGFLIPPEKVTLGPARLRVFVNGRVIRDRMIIHAVTEGMRSFLMKGKNPSGLIHLTIPPAEVDVNVHPAKHEVRFRSSREIHELINQTVARAMRDQQAAMKMTIFSMHRSNDQTAIPLDLNLVDEQPDYGFVSLLSPPAAPAEDIPPPPTAAPLGRLPTPVPAAKTPRPQSLLTTAEPLPNHVAPRGNPISPREGASEEGRPSAHNLQVIGQYDNLYIFCRNNDGLLIIDQHAAHERLLYEKFRRQYHAATIARQTLMFPVTIELSLFQTQLVEKNGDEIDRMGFSIRDFGGNTFIISAIPALAGTTNPCDLFLDILQQFGSESSSDRRSCLDTVLATMACKAAVKAGTLLNSPEIDKLLNEMAKADLFSHCPHGRPVVKQFTRDEIKKWFYRT
ncbi:MAG: DNA mismatch repair endonuclease MutL [Proteobacteria bacterium]|nr:DNA mismatch repair endonuclease MutL [Pseudomonadota bacterium]